MLRPCMKHPSLSRACETSLRSMQSTPIGSWNGKTKFFSPFHLPNQKLNNGDAYDSRSSALPGTSSGRRQHVALPGTTAGVLSLLNRLEFFKSRFKKFDGAEGFGVAEEIVGIMSQPVADFVGFPEVINSEQFGFIKIH